MAKKDFEFRIYGAATSGVEHTIASSNLRSAPTVLGAMVDVLKGRTQTRPWEVEVNDNGDFFSAIIADSGGRMAIQGRLCDLRLNKDGAGFSVIGTGRIGDVVDHVSHYTLSVQDERWRERTATIFTKQNVTPGSGSSSQYGGSVLLPAGLIDDYRHFRPRIPLGMQGTVFSRDNNLAFILTDDIQTKTNLADLNEKLRDIIVGDVKTDARVDAASTLGNFDSLRANIDGTDFEVATFDVLFGDSDGAGEDDPDVQIQPAETIVASLDQFDGIIPGFWVMDDGASLSTGTDVRAYLYTPTAEPTELMPLHIGGKDGIRPFQALKDAYDEIGIVYSSSAMQDLIDDADFGVAWWRITKPVVLGDWAEDHIYGPYGVVPLPNATGAIAPTKIHLPQDIASTDLFEFDKTNTARQPTWQHSARDRVTAIRFKYTHEGTVARRPFDGDWPADLIRVLDREIERTHDRLDSGQAPRREVTYALDGVHSGGHVFPGNPPSAGSQVWNLDRFVDTMARERFERFGDAPIRGDFVGLSTTEDVGQGDFVRVTLETFPSAANQGRGQTRIVQILSRIDTPAGPEFEWLDVGPDLNKLVAPTVTLAATTSDAKHSVVATISGSSSTDVGYQLQWGSGSTEPGSTSWKDWAGQGDSTGTNTIRPLPSGTIVWVRARTTFQGRIRSAWSTAPNTTTESLQAPTALASSSITSTTVLLDWDLGSSESPDYPLELRASTGTCPTTDVASLARLTARSRRFKAEGMTADTTHCFALRHFDDFGGVSADATLTVQHTTTTPVTPSLVGVGIEVIAGSTCG